MSSAPPDLTSRQERILGAVVRRFVESGAPVGSKHLAGSEGIDGSPSTVRYELARLEELGYLTHPHTSAGRVPTDRGYRYFVDVLLRREPETLPAAPESIGQALEAPDISREVDTALQTLAEAMAKVTNLLGVVTAPAAQGATVRHVEVLLLQPQVVMVVVISSTGTVTKRVVATDRPVDPGLAEWARAVFAERVTGMPVGSRSAEARLFDPGMSPVERAFLGMLLPAIRDAGEEVTEHLFVGGRARFVADARRDLDTVDALMEQLEERYTLLALLRGALSRHEVYLHIGDELAAPGLTGVSMVAANYGVVRRNLGTVSLFGPTRMDYGLAIATVREAAHRLSAYLEGVYE
ncbi:MAG: heat-inducible transcriptional repressor HrcA [Thermoleophilia bacterium]